jgi:hypothetical protein
MIVMIFVWQEQCKLISVRYLVADFSNLIAQPELGKPF